GSTSTRDRLDAPRPLADAGAVAAKKTKLSAPTSDEVPVEAKVTGIEATMARIEALLEEQKVQTTMILEGIATLLRRQNQLEERMDRIEETVRRLAAAAPARGTPRPPRAEWSGPGAGAGLGRWPPPLCNVFEVRPASRAKPERANPH